MDTTPEQFGVRDVNRRWPDRLSASFRVGAAERPGPGRARAGSPVRVPALLQSGLPGDRDNRRESPPRRADECGKDRCPPGLQARAPMATGDDLREQGRVAGVSRLLASLGKEALIRGELPRQPEPGGRGHRPRARHPGGHARADGARPRRGRRPDRAARPGDRPGRVLPPRRLPARYPRRVRHRRARRAGRPCRGHRLEEPLGGTPATAGARPAPRPRPRPRRAWRSAPPRARRRTPRHHREVTMGRRDLDALRAEADTTPHEVVLGGRTYRFRATLPLEFTELLNEGKFVQAVKLLLVDPSEWEQMRAAVPDAQDLSAIAEMYALALPESSGSQPSSRNGDGSSPPTSGPTTSSVSPKRASGRGRSGSASSST